MADERRTEDRKVPKGPQQGKLSMHIGGRALPVKAVVDVSPTGVGLLVSEDVRIGTSVEVSYLLDVVEIHMAGITVWTSRRQTPDDNPDHNPDDNSDRCDFAVGINLFSPTLLHNLL